MQLVLPKLLRAVIEGLKIEHAESMEQARVVIEWQYQRRCLHAEEDVSHLCARCSASLMASSSPWTATPRGGVGCLEFGTEADARPAALPNRCGSSLSKTDTVEMHVMWCPRACTAQLIEKAHAHVSPKKKTLLRAGKLGIGRSQCKPYVCLLTRFHAGRNLQGHALPVRLQVMMDSGHCTCHHAPARWYGCSYFTTCPA